MNSCRHVDRIESLGFSVLIWFLCFEYQGPFHGTLYYSLHFLRKGLVTFVSNGMHKFKLNKCLWN